MGPPGKQAELDLAGHGDVALQLSFLATDALIETGVLNRNGDLGGKRCKHALVLFIEEAGARVLEVEDADDAALVKQRDDQLRAGLGVHGEVAGIFAHVGHIDGTPLADRCANQSAVDGDAAHGGMDCAESPAIAGDEGFTAVVEEHDGEHLVIDEAAEELTDTDEEGVEIEDGGELDGDFVQDLKGLRLAGDACVEAGVLDGLCDSGGGKGEDVEVLGAEVVGEFALEVHDADEAIFCDEGDGELGADIGVGGDVVFVSGNVIEKDGLASEGDLADYAFADGDSGALSLGGVADLKAHAEVVGAIVE